MDLKEKIDNLPKTPGIYMMKDKYGDIIYVGKSKKLKERVKSYFTNSKNHSKKVKRMVKNIEDLDVILTDTELDALLLECEMIKKIRPMYNQLMKNHENYSYIKINKNINYPYIEVSKEIEDDSLYLGPYTMDKKLDEIVNIISREYKIRTCKIMNKCIKYDLNKCVGPCREIISRKDYNIIIDKIINDLNNSNENLINILNKKMQDEISKLNFEKANDINHDISLLKSLSYKQNIINNANENKLILAWINLDNENIKIYIIKGAKLLKSEIIKIENFKLNDLIYKIKENILKDNEDIDEEVVDKYYIDFANIVYSYIKNNKDINYKYIQ
nr:GIY-YIG nuclease family protein [uncultured Romboutsia sp.]